MKKAILLLAAFFIVAQASFAYYEEYKTSDIVNLQGKGYSQDLLRIIDTSRYLKQGVEKDYVPYYPREFYSENPILKYYQMAQRYWDPGVDSPDFGFKEISFQNRWFDFSPSYNSKINPNDRYQRLFDKDIKRLEYTGKIVKDSNGDEEKAKQILNVKDETPSKTQTTKDEFVIEDL